ncbi:hypothetical protein EV424DRAFT_1102654 [Suillus variegatus]|nr:hypothetical protein EV424DRAFT_1102654 [Suillus variegatus]
MSATKLSHTKTRSLRSPTFVTFGPRLSLDFFPLDYPTFVHNALLFNSQSHTPIRACSAFQIPHPPPTFTLLRHRRRRLSKSSSLPSSSLANENFAHPLDSLSAPSPTSYSYVTSPAVVHPQHPSSLVSKAATYLTLSETRRRMTACSTQPLQKALSQRPVIRVLALPLLLVFDDSCDYYFTCHPISFRNSWKHYSWAHVDRYSRRQRLGRSRNFGQHCGKPFLWKYSCPRGLGDATSAVRLICVRYTNTPRCDSQLLQPCHGQQRIRQALATCLAA